MMDKRVDKKLSVYVFGWALVAVLAVFSFYAGWLWRIDSAGLSERRLISEKYEKKFDKLVDDVNKIRIDIGKLGQ